MWKTNRSDLFRPKYFSFVILTPVPGSLSGWMRLRFPHLVAGSVSSSGPLFAKLDYYEYLQVFVGASKFFLEFMLLNYC